MVSEAFWESGKVNRELLVPLSINMPKFSGLKLMPGHLED